MKRYTRKEMNEATKLTLLERLGTVQEIVGSQARVVITFEDLDVLCEISTLSWFALEEAE